MPTVDFVSPGGAFTPAATGDTQELTTTWTIGSGSNALQCNGATPFVVGDVGKSFTLNGAGASGGYLNGTIAGFTDSSHVTLSVTASTALSATSEYFAWGTDDAPAFQAFNTWAQAQTSAITLTLGSGSHKFFIASSDPTSGRGNSLAYGITTQTLHVLGNGPSSTRIIARSDVGWSLGVNAAFAVGDGVGIKVNPVSIGATQVTCKTPSDASGFVVGQWLMLGGINMQNSGAPPNQFYFEYLLITGSNAGTGVVTFSTSTVNAYLDTWPIFSDTVNGGPACIFAMNALWYMNITYEAFSLNNTSTQTYAKGYNFQFINITQVDPFGITPSQSFSNSFTNCDLTSYQMEYDKCIYKTVFDSTTTGQLLFQNAANKVIIQNGCNITNSLNGTPRDIEIHDSTINDFVFGTLAFGRTDSFVTTNSTFTGSYAYAGAGTQGDATGNLQTDYPMTGGVITMPKSKITYGCTWMIPGTICFFATTGGFPQVNWGPMFKILAVTDDATNVYVMTDWPYGGYPSWAQKIQAIPTNYMNFANNTTSAIADIANFVTATTAGYSKPYQYTTAQFNGGNLGIDGAPAVVATFVQAVGKLTSYTINVVTPYTGTQNPLFWHAFAQFDNAGIVQSDLSRTVYGPHIDLRTGGIRTITPAGANLLGNDSALAVPSNPTWFQGPPALCASQNIQAEYNGNPSVGPVINIVLLTDQTTGLAPITVTGGIFAIQNQSNMVIRGRTR